LAVDESRQLARRLLRLRQERRRHFAPVDVTGPAWDLVLVLFGLPGEERDLCVGDLAMRASIPRTTTVRWVRQLDKHGFVSLFDDSKDKRAVRVKLTPAGERAVEWTFAAANLKVR
jgi:DNA-binding MarR family transcriptional regulator